MAPLASSKCARVSFLRFAAEHCEFRKLKPEASELLATKQIARACRFYQEVTAGEKDWKKSWMGLDGLKFIRSITNILCWRDALRRMLPECNNIKARIGSC